MLPTPFGAASRHARLSPYRKKSNVAQTCNVDPTRRLVCSYCSYVRPELAWVHCLARSTLARSASLAPSVHIVLDVMRAPLVANLRHTFAPLKCKNRFLKWNAA